MCPKTAGISRTPPNHNMPDQILQQILDEVVPFVFRIDLVGDGEILLVPHLVQKVLETAALHKVLVNASTNGVLLTEKLSEMLVAGGLHDLNLSLDAANDRTYREIRGADLQKVLKNLETLNRVKMAAGSPFPLVQLSMVGMKRNIDQLPDLVNLAADYQAASVMIQAMGEFEAVANESVSLRDRNYGKQCLLKADEIAASRGVKIHLWPPGQFDENQSSASSPSESSRTPSVKRLKDCDFPWDVPYFATDGSVRPCCAMPPLGNLAESSFRDIWMGPQYTLLRTRMKTETPPDECIRCPGRGWYDPIECRSELRPGYDDRQFGTGWFETESYKNEYYRWARENAVFFIAGQGPGLMEIELHTVWDIGTTQSADIQIDCSSARTVSFQFGERRIVRLPVENEENMHTVRISGKGWRPVLTVAGELDPRSLSVMFYGAQMLSMCKPVCFSESVRLHGWELVRNTPAGSYSLRLFGTGTIHASMISDNSFTFFRFHSGSTGLQRQASNFSGSWIDRDVSRLDMNLPKPDHPGEVSLQNITLTPPRNWIPAPCAVFMGLTDVQGKRLKPTLRESTVYRSAIRLGEMELP